MSARVARRLRDGVLGVSSLGVVAAGMWGLNQSLRESVSITAGERSLAFLPAAHVRFSQVNHVSQTLGVSIADHMPLVFFACISLVLFVVMFRS